MTRIENIKAQIAAASVEELAEILVDPDEIFTCRKCESFKPICPDICDFECKKHCINWLNSETEE